MRRPYSRLAAACAFAVAMTAFTGSAFAGNGQGNDTAPGQQKQDEAAATQAATPATATAQPPAQQSAQGQSGNEPPGQVKKQATATATASAQSSSQAQTGVKPDSTTTHWTHCTTGGSPSATACTSSDGGHTPQPNPDASKLYGNGKTAAQIAVSRPGGSGVRLTGPGNSQPHKVTACGKPNNKSGGVDVHAVKSYSTAGCTQTTMEAAATAPCGFVVVATTSAEGKSQGHGKGLAHNRHEKSTTSYSVKPDLSHSCNSAAVTAATQATVAAATQVASPVVQASPVTHGSPAVPAKKHAGGVLGVQKTLVSPKPAGHGVLGTVTNVAGSRLPFTGFPIWLAFVIALALIPAGLALRRRGAVARL